MMTLFEYIIIHRPPTTQQDRDAGKKAKPVVLVDLKRVFAEGQQQANMMAVRDIPSEFVDKLEEVDIVLRPF